MLQLQPYIGHLWHVLLKVGGLGSLHNMTLTHVQAEVALMTVQFIIIERFFSCVSSLDQTGRFLWFCAEAVKLIGCT